LYHQGAFDVKKYTGLSLMESAPPGQAIIRMALPMMAAMIAQSIYNMTDMFFIGQTGNPDMVAAISLVFPLFMLSQAVGNIFATGASSYVSRMLGAKDSGAARRATSVSFWLSLATGFLLTVIMVIFKTPVLEMIGASAHTIADADSYFTVVALFMALAAAGTVFSGQMRSEGATNKAMILQMAGIVTNIILDPVLILWLDMGTAGAAWATVAGQAVSFAYGVWYFLSGKSSLSIGIREFRPDGGMMRGILSIGIPAGLANILMSASAIFANRIAAGYGDHVVAGSGVMMRICSLCFSLVFALGQGYQPFAGYNYGAKNFDRMRKGFLLTMLYSTIFCVAGCALFLLKGETLIRFFVNDAATIEAGAVMLRCFVLGLPFMGIQITFMMTFQAIGRAVESTVINMGRQLIFYLPMLFVLTKLFGFAGFVWVQPAADILSVLIALALSRPLFRLLRGSEKLSGTVSAASSY
jgi:putative MATE family efflux protein